MELKVYVDGIQRVVCGVTLETTCADVVFALCHATGQTGRFTMIEKWRHNERLLAPSEQPVAVLAKWGEYANDVLFLLKKSSDVTTTTKQLAPNSQFSISSPQSTLSRSSMKSKVNSSCPAVNIPQEPSNKHVHKQEKAHKKGNGTVAKDPKLDMLLMAHLSEASSNASHSDESLNANKDIYSANLQQPSQSHGYNHRPKLPPTYDEALAKSHYFQASSSQSGSATNTPPPPPSGNGIPPSKKASHDLPAVNHEAFVEYDNFNEPMPHTSTMNSSNSSSDSKKRRMPPVSSSSPSTVAANTQTKQSKGFHNDHTPTSSSKLPKGVPVDGSPKTLKSPNPRDPFQVISGIQRNALLQENLMDLDGEESSQPVYKENEDEEKARALKQQMKRMEEIWLNNELELTQLEEEYKIREQTLLKQEQEKIQSEKKKLSLKSNEIDSQIAVCRQKIQVLTDQIAEEQHRIEREQRSRELAEEKEKQKILDDIRSQLDEKIEQTEMQSKEAESIHVELKRLDESLQEKREAVEAVAQEIKKENLQDLSTSETPSSILNGNGVSQLKSSTSAKLVPAESVGAPALGFYNRIGSTRKMVGYPRQLENAVATNKNPNGVWV